MRSVGNVTLEWKYPKGKREVPNPDCARLVEKVARADKAPARQKDW